MICNLCGTQEATIHLTEIVNNQMVEIHLCEACAEEKGTDFKTHFNLGDLLAGMTEITKSLKTVDKQAIGRCPGCSMSYEDFAKTGRLGCPACYDSFLKLLLPLIKRVQRSTTHVGKKPSKVSKQIAANHDLRILQERLRKSVQSEEFEESARLRDEIRQLEEKSKKTKKGKP